jgi:hypothetical protein
MDNLAPFLGSHIIKFSHVYKYAIIGESSCISKAPLPYGSISSSWKFPLSDFVWGTSPKHPNRVHRYAKTCHPNTASKSTSPCQQALVVFSLLELGFRFNPLASRLSLPALCNTLKSYSWRINAHLANFLVRWFDFIKNLSGQWSITKMNGLP